MIISIAQCRAARALLGWSAADLATAGEIGIVTIKRFEGGHVVSAASIERMAATLTDAGIAFMNDGEPSSGGGAGVRLSVTSTDDEA